MALTENKIQTAQGNSGLAEQSLKEATKIYNNLTTPPSVDVAIKLSSSLIESGDPDASKVILKDLARDNLHNSDTLDKIQQVFDDHDIGDEGRSAISSVSKSIVGINNKGVSLAKGGDLEEAKKLFKKALDEMPNNITIHINYIQVLLMEMKTNNLSTKDQMSLNSSIKLIREREPDNIAFNRLMSIYNQKQG